MRPTRYELNMMIAELISERATCLRAKVGCVILKDNRIVSTGYNGPIIPGKHCEHLQCDLDNKCIHSIHAEANAIAAAAKNGIALDDCVMFCTHGTCYECAKLIVQAGIRKVVYKVPYHDVEGLGLMRLNGVEVDPYE